MAPEGTARPRRPRGRPETALAAGAPGFQPTLWTQVLAARSRAPDALEALLRAYWRPIYFYVRRWGAEVEDAKDLTQGFFAEFLEREFLKEVAREKGRFRAFLLVALKHYLINSRERARARKRGGGRAAIPLDFVSAETAYGRLAVARDDPERQFQRQWALTVLARALERLGAELTPERFRAVRPHLVPGDAPHYQETARLLGIPESQVKNLVHRTRRRYRELLRAEVRTGVAGEADVDAEIRDLFAAL
jgi:RNA polymerase sigma-70 factor (ECF subfamily)